MTQGFSCIYCSLASFFFIRYHTGSIIIANGQLNVMRSRQLSKYRQTKSILRCFHKGTKAVPLLPVVTALFCGFLFFVPVVTPCATTMPHFPYRLNHYSSNTGEDYHGKQTEQWLTLNYTQTPYKGDPIAPAKPSTCGHSRYYNHAGDHKLKIPSAIVGGIAALPKEFPWLVRLQITDPISNVSQLCSANILSASAMITAAHCVLDVAKRPDLVIAVVGEHDITSPVNSLFYNKWAVGFSGIHIHPLHKLSSNDYDVAILEVNSDGNILEQLFDDWTAQPICLPTSCSDGCQSGQLVKIAGWGAASQDNPLASRVLLKADIPIVPFPTCYSAFKRLNQDISPRMICAGSEYGGVDTCFGDSGGPLMSAENGYFHLCGITSFGDGCGKPGIYGVYTRICALLPWIRETIAL